MLRVCFEPLEKDTDCENMFVHVNTHKNASNTEEMLSDQAN
jgi:hypothetical protein